MDKAIVEAVPVPNMIDFYQAMGSHFPTSENFILSARPRSLYRDTLAWLDRYHLVDTATVCLLPRADGKPRIWQRLAQDASLIVIDDLGYGHETAARSVYTDLVRRAVQTATVYVGLDQIELIARDAEAVSSIASQTLRAASPLTSY